MPPFLGLAVALLLLALVEAYLHTDGFLYRYRSVFAAGRAMDKIAFVEGHAPRLLLLGNSRVDNGFNPRVLAEELSLYTNDRAFNLGIPGADARVLHAVLSRLEQKGLLGRGGIEWIIIGLDEGLVQADDSLGYAVFYSDRLEMLRGGEYRDWLRSCIRLWGYADNLKELREPAKLQRFIEATLRPVEPLGGGAAASLGYRPGIGELQDVKMALTQEIGSRAPPDANRVRYLGLSLDLLARSRVKVAMVYPPLLSRDVLYLNETDPDARPFKRLANGLHDRGLRIIELEPGVPRSTDEFVNPGHLNDRGATRFSRVLAKELASAWPELAKATP